MTDTDKRVFAGVFSHLAVALRSPEPDVTLMQVYFEALRDHEVEFVVEAAKRLMRGEFFPTAGAWGTAARQIERERREAQRDLLRKLPVPLCAACGDTGWFDAGPGLTDSMRQAASRVGRCGCQELRRLEILGRRPCPALPRSSEPPDEKAM